MKLNRLMSAFALVATFVAASVSFAANGSQTTSKFEGPKANTTRLLSSSETSATSAMDGSEAVRWVTTTSDTQTGRNVIAVL